MFLIGKMNLLKECLSFYHKEEPFCCLKDLEVHHFKHELVYEAVVMVLERTDSRLLLLSWILNSLPQSCQVYGRWGHDRICPYTPVNILPTRSCNLVFCVTVVVVLSSLQMIKKKRMIFQRQCYYY